MWVDANKLTGRSSHPRREGKVCKEKGKGRRNGREAKGTSGGALMLLFALCPSAGQMAKIISRPQMKQLTDGDESLTSADAMTGDKLPSEKEAESDLSREDGHDASVSVSVAATRKDAKMERCEDGEMQG